MANLLATVRVSALILLIVSMHMSCLEGTTLFLDGKAMEKRVDSQSLFRKLGFRNEKPSERRALSDTARVAPEGPDPQHHYIPPAFF
ncbi:hypothetical protein ACJRO7_017252 [Eucalyptus globulus]|uniref:Uncharacterized protein n=1 Tax=Eucalyptus globulus TaxID=34317 RepID=A0ABD3KPK8_EUCGL